MMCIFNYLIAILTPLHLLGVWLDMRLHDEKGDQTRSVKINAVHML
jgi:hypothetical protein